MIQKEVLHGGREGKISKEEDKIHNIPKPYGINESGMEMVSFVHGTVYNDSLPNEILTDEILIEVAKLLRRYHDIGEKYVHRLTGEEVWMLHMQYTDGFRLFRRKILIIVII